METGKETLREVKFDDLVKPFNEFHRGDFVTYYEPVVQAHVVINIQDFYITEDFYQKASLIHVYYKRWVYYKAYNLKNGFLYHDGSKMGIIFEHYSDVRLSNPNEIQEYKKALKREGLTL